MSKIHLPIAELKPALVGLGKIISRKSTLPVLQSIKVVRTTDGWITLTSTDLDHCITVRLEQPAEGAPVEMLVPHEHLSRITKRCGKSDSITVSKAEGDKILCEFPIGNQMGQEHVDTLPVGEYPPVPQINGDAVAIKDDIRSSLLEAFQCGSTDETRVILNGAYLDVSGKQGHYIVATDGRHLYSSNSFTLGLQKSLFIPENKFLVWKDFTADGEWRLRVQPGEKDNVGLFQISSRRWTFIGRQIEGNYPNWKQVVPDENQFLTTVVLTPAAIDAILALIPKIPCHDVVNNPIGLVVEDRKLMLVGRGANETKFTGVNVEGATVKGKPMTVSLNRHVLTKALKFGMSTISLVDPLTPLKFSSGGKQMIVMPLRPSDPAPAAKLTPPTASTDATSPPAQQPPTEAEQSSPIGDTERSTAMPKAATNGTTVTNGTTTNGNGHTNDGKSPLENAFDQIETIKGSYRDAIRGLNTLADTLKQVHRDQRTSEKEVQNVRTTLEKLQQVRI